MKKITKLFIILTIIGLGNFAKAQTTLLEKSFEIERSARKGDLKAVDVNKEKGTIELVYAIPNKAFSNKIRCEVYSYSKDLDFIGKEDLEFESEKFKGRRVRKDETYTTIDASPRIGFPVQVVFKKKEVARRFDWLTMSFKTTEKLLDKIIPKTGEDGKYNFTCKYDVLQYKTVLVLAGKHKAKTAEISMKYDILLGDADGNVTVTESLDFDRPVTVIYDGPLTDENEADEFDLTRDWIIVFAPGLAKTFPNVSPTTLTYVRISPKGKIIEKFNIESPSNRWEINSAKEHGGSVYLSGGAITKEPTVKYHSELYNSNKASVFTNIQICKLTDKKVDFITSPSLADIAAKQSKPTNQKSAVEFDGESVIVKPLVFASNGDILLNCQDNVKKDFANNYLLSFDSKGTFKKYYGVTLAKDEKVNVEQGDIWDVPYQNYYIPSADGKKTYWLMRNTKNALCITTTTEASDPTGARGMSGLSATSVTICRPGFAFDIVSINNETGEMNELKTTGRGDKDEFYLYILATDIQQIDNYLFTVSETKKGNKIMLSRLDISK